MELHKKIESEEPSIEREPQVVLLSHHSNKTFYYPLSSEMCKLESYDMEGMFKPTNGP